MAKCILCREKDQNRPGGLCYGCYLDKFRDRLPGPGIEDEAALMKWVIDGAPCTTDVQKKYKADWNKNPRGFVAQYKELTGIAKAVLPNGNLIAVGDWAQTEGWPAPDWAKTPKCPCCKRPAPIKDPNVEKVRELINEEYKRLEAEAKVS